MPHLKTETISARTEMGASSIKVAISVSTKGFFYANLNDEYEEAIKGVFEGSWEYQNNNKIKVYDYDLDKLESNLSVMLKLHIEPNVTEEHVILYNIESHISFATDDEGNVYPRGGLWGEDKKEAKWNTNFREGMYGEHHSSQPSKNGYSLTIGAVAKTKITYTYGNSTKVEYKDYYKGGHHLDHDNPAQLLNSWCSFHLKDCKEIPYSDESAIFFHNLMMGMARLSKIIQENTFDQTRLLQLIDSGANPLLPSPKK